jgi:hypothetical protein
MVVAVQDVLSVVVFVLLLVVVMMVKIPSKRQHHSSRTHINLMVCTYFDK